MQYAVMDKNNNPILLARNIFSIGNQPVNLDVVPPEDLTKLNLYKVLNVNIKQEQMTGSIEGTRVRVDHNQRIIFIEQVMVSNQFSDILNTLKNADIAQLPVSDQPDQTEVQSGTAPAANDAPAPSDAPSPTPPSNTGE